MANVVSWFEIPVTNMDRAKRFYGNVMEKEMEDMPAPMGEMVVFPMEPNAENAPGALVKMEGFEPSQSGSLVYFACEDLANELGRVEENGGKVLVPKTDIGEFGFFAQFEDTEGNRVALHSNQ